MPISVWSPFEAIDKLWQDVSNNNDGLQDETRIDLGENPLHFIEETKHNKNETFHFKLYVFFFSQKICYLNRYGDAFETSF